MIRAAAYCLYLLSPYLLIYELLFHDGFDWKLFLYFSIMLHSVHSVATDIKAIVVAKQMETDFQSFKGEFSRISLSSRLAAPIEAVVKEARAGRLTLLQLAATSSLKMMLAGLERRCVIVTLSVCRGDYIPAYTCRAVKRFAVIFIPDDFAVLQADPQRRFYLYHELGHTISLNVSIFNRQISEVFVFVFILFLVVLTNQNDLLSFRVLFSILGAIIFFAYVVMHLVWSGRLFAEIYADNFATRMALWIDPTTLSLLKTLKLPNDQKLRAVQEKRRRERFLDTLSIYESIGLVNPLTDFNIPLIDFSIKYVVLISFICYMLVWGRGLERQYFDFWWIFLIGATLMSSLASLQAEKAKTAILEKISGGTITFTIDPPESGGSVAENSAAT